MGTFVITKRKNGYYKYEFVSRKGTTILISNDFELRFECEENIEIVKNHIDTIFFMKFKSKNSKFYFKIILLEKEIAVSRKFSTELMMQKGIDEFKRAFKSDILDFSNDSSIFAEL
ncbi:MAG: DUF1508 domain-containing protein [Flavobacterium sp.]